MNKLDTVYFEAIMHASEGTMPVGSLRLLSENARKFVIIDEPVEAVRFYERIFQLWRTIKEFGTHALCPESTLLFAATLSEYIALLKKLNRSERAEQVNQALPGVPVPADTKERTAAR